VPEDRVALAKFSDMLPSMIRDRNFKASPVDVRSGGLPAVEKGLAEMKVSQDLTYYANGARRLIGDFVHRLERSQARSL
jgi:hypothetical protein